MCFKIKVSVISIPRFSLNENKMLTTNIKKNSRRQDFLTLSEYINYFN